MVIRFNLFRSNDWQVINLDEAAQALSTHYGRDMLGLKIELDSGVVLSGGGYLFAPIKCRA